ncbi:MAG TPA: hypothetical protein VKV02_03820 [Acidobacteriaceae bacterium]|nr:hypothetical protein [Acidobacteriaceae bacterium]
MLFRKLLPVLAAVAALSCTAAHAQFGVFATVTGERIGGVACAQSVGGSVGSCTSGTTTDKPYGATFGGYYDFHSFGPVRVGAEVRGGVLNTNKDPGANIASSDLIREYTALGGVRASVGTPIKWIRPYAGFAVGYDKFGPVYGYNTYTKAEGLLGVDVPVTSFLDIRAIELGAGALFGSTSHGTQSIGAGLVFHTTR